MQETDRIPYEIGELPSSKTGSALILAPHPDDEVFGCGGAAAQYVNNGVRVQAFVLSDGGLWGQPRAGLSIVETRRLESIEASHILGCTPPRFGVWPDRSLNCDDAVVASIVTAIQETDADIVFAPSLWEIHPDHFEIALAALKALEKTARSCFLIQYEVGSPLLPNCLVDISSVMDMKDRAIGCFVSQLAMQSYDRHMKALNTYRTYTLPGHVLAAEAFRVADLRSALNDPYGLQYNNQSHPVRQHLLSADSKN